MHRRGVRGLIGDNTRGTHIEQEVLREGVVVEGVELVKVQCS